MFVPLMLSLLLPAAVPAPTLVNPSAADPPAPIKVWLSDDVFTRGDRARLHVQTAQDGYLVVLRADADGHIRVLFPDDPGDSNFVRGGRKLEIRGRGGREAFTVDERAGSGGGGGGTVLAARSSTPLKFDEFTRGGHWDYHSLSTQAADSDAEGALLDIAQRMAGDHFDYDVVSYTVSNQPRYRRYAGWYNPWVDPFYYPCFGCGPRFGLRVGFVFGRPYRYRRFRW